LATNNNDSADVTMFPDWWADNLESPVGRQLTGWSATRLSGPKYFGASPCKTLYARTAILNFGRSTYSSVHCRWQSVSCYSRSSVEQSFITRHCCPPLSPSSAVVLNHTSSHFLIPLSDSSLICTVPVQW